MITYLLAIMLMFYKYDRGNKCIRLWICKHDLSLLQMHMNHTKKFTNTNLYLIWNSFPHYWYAYLQTAHWLSVLHIQNVCRSCFDSRVITLFGSIHVWRTSWVGLIISRTFHISWNTMTAGNVPIIQHCGICGVVLYGQSHPAGTQSVSNPNLTVTQEYIYKQACM